MINSTMPAAPTPIRLLYRPGKQVLCAGVIRNFKPDVISHNPIKKRYILPNYHLIVVQQIKYSAEYVKIG
jgi:hypothetical protein